MWLEVDGAAVNEAVIWVILQFKNTIYIMWLDKILRRELWFHFQFSIKKNYDINQKNYFEKLPVWSWLKKSKIEKSKKTILMKIDIMKKN